MGAAQQMSSRSTVLPSASRSRCKKLVKERKVEAVVVAAPARTLADLRGAFHADVKSKIVAEIDKDLTNHPIGEIERHLVG